MNIKQLNLSARIIEVIVVTCFISAATKNILDSFGYGYDSWSMTDLLINYQGGFVRRGLIGELSFQVAKVFDVAPNYVAICIALISFLFVLIYTIRKTNIPYYVLLSPALIGAAAYGQFIIRKDFLMISGIIGMLTVLNSRLSVQLKFIILNLLILMTSLIHEAFLFLAAGLILNVILFKKIKIRSIFVELTKYPAIPFAAVLIFRSSGDSSTANAINKSLITTWQSISGNGCCLKPEATIGSIAWGPRESYEITKTILTSFSHGIWIPLGWTFSFSLAVVALILNISNLNSKIFLRTVLIQVIAFTPILIIGWDYGRWAFLLLTVSSLSYCAFFGRDSLDTKRLVWPLKQNRDLLSRAVLLFVALPICCWSVEIYVGSTPIGYVWFNIIKPLVL